MTTLFISDLHLDPERPEITALFGHFLDGEARSADALYILGDLFEAWVGDDDPSEAGAMVAQKLHALSASGVPVFFIRGNRDFLLGTGYAARCGMTVLDDPTIIDLYGTPTLLLHGDLLCSDDTAYQQFRAQTRDPHWQAQFLAQPLAAAKRTGLPLYCGEFGVYSTTPRPIREAWYRDFVAVLAEQGIGWANWDYKGGFALVQNGRSTGLAEIMIAAARG